MGWRDTQRAVASGAMSFRPEAPDDIREGIGLLLKTRANSIMDAAERQREASMVAMEEAKERRKKIHEEREAQEKLDRKRTKQARMILSNIAYPGMDPKDVNLINHVKGNLEVFGDDAAKTLAYYEDLGERFTYAASKVDMAKPGRAGDLNQQTAESMGLDATKIVETPVGKSPTTVKTDARNKMEVSESSGDPTASVVEARKGRKHAGLLGFGQARLEDYNRIYGTTYTPDTFAQLSVAEQDKVGDWHFNDISNFIRSKGLDKFIGEEINGTVLTESSIVAMAHLGGKTGVLRYLQTDGRVNAHDLVIDKNGKEVKTYMSDYARKFANSGSFTMQEDTGGLDPAFKTPVILPKKPDVNNDDPTSFEGLVVASLLKSPEYRTATPEKQAEMAAAAKASLSTSSKVAKLDAGTVRALYADAQLKLASGDQKLIAEGESYMKYEYPKHREALTLSFKETSEGDEAVAFINGVMVPGTVGADQSFIPMGRSESIMPQTEDNPDGYTGLSSIDVEKMGAQAVSRASAELDAGFNGVTNAIDVLQQGYELEKLARQHPQILTAIGGTAVSSFVSAKRELGALLDVIGLGAEGETRSSVEAKVQDYLNSANYQGTESEAQVYKEFSSAMIRYIFAAGKALGQQGNGFSNADYNNIRNSMLSGNGIEDFASGMQRFSRERTEAADNLAIGTRNRTSIQELSRYGRDVGNDLMTVEERLSDLSSQSNRDLPDYIGWMNGNVSFPSADANIETLSRSKEDRAKWDAAPSGTNFNVQQRDGTYVTVTKP